MAIDGIYDITVTAASGPETMTIELETSGAELSGRVKQGDESKELLEPAYAGNHVTFKLRISQPMPLTLSLAADIEGDLISGAASVAGMKLPFEGKRV